ncbi:MAG: Maf family protein [Woeseiaceae bacterium]|nr:Maf family protein [Woeseiaceae bacterium]
MNKSIAPVLQLASKSPRRRQILASLGIRFDVVEVATDECQLKGEAPSDLVLRLAAAKAEATSYGSYVLGADTVVVSGDRVFGKPKDAKEAVDMLLSLSGRRHTVFTGVALKAPEGIRKLISITDVEFREIGKDEAVCYWQSGEPVDKAGAYGIQGLGGMFVKNIRGSYSGVMGLPVFETVELLTLAGIEIFKKKT